MPKDTPKVQFTKGDLYGLVSRDLSALQPQPQPQPPAQEQAALDRYAAMRESIRTRKLMPFGPAKTL